MVSRKRPNRTTEKQRCPSSLVKPCDGAFLMAWVFLRGRPWAYLKMLASIGLELYVPFKLNVCIPSPNSHVSPVIAKKVESSIRGRSLKRELGLGKVVRMES